MKTNKSAKLNAWNNGMPACRQGRVNGRWKMFLSLPLWGSWRGLLFFLFLTVPSLAQNSQVNWSAFGSGFGVSNSTTSGTISLAGQSFAGTNTNGSSRVISGFLAYTSTIVTDITDDQKIIPTVYKLNQNYPNPFNPSTIINYQIPEEGFVILKVYDILGNEVKTLVSDQKAVGSYNIIFDASGLATGFYIYRLTANNFVSTKKMLMIK